MLESKNRTGRRQTKGITILNDVNINFRLATSPLCEASEREIARRAPTDHRTSRYRKRALKKSGGPLFVLSQCVPYSPA